MSEENKKELNPCGKKFCADVSGNVDCDDCPNEKVEILKQEDTEDYAQGWVDGSDAQNEADHEMIRTLEAQLRVRKEMSNGFAKDCGKYREEIDKLQAQLSSSPDLGKIRDLAVEIANPPNSAYLGDLANKAEQILALLNDISSPWIRVEERLPDKEKHMGSELSFSGEVIVSNSANIALAYYDYEIGGWLTEDGEKLELYKPTHWLSKNYIPQVPQRERDITQGEWKKSIRENCKLKINNHPESSSCVCCNSEDMDSKNILCTFMYCPKLPKEKGSEL